MSGVIVKCEEGGVIRQMKTRWRWSHECGEVVVVEGKCWVK